MTLDRLKSMALQLWGVVKKVILSDGTGQIAAFFVLGVWGVIFWAAKAIYAIFKNG